MDSAIVKCHQVEDLVGRGYSAVEHQQSVHHGCEAVGAERLGRCLRPWPQCRTLEPHPERDPDGQRPGARTANTQPVHEISPRNSGEIRAPKTSSAASLSNPQPSARPAPCRGEVAPADPDAVGEKIANIAGSARVETIGSLRSRCTTPVTSSPRTKPAVRGNTAVESTVRCARPTAARPAAGPGHIPAAMSSPDILPAYEMCVESRRQPAPPAALAGPVVLGWLPSSG